MSVTDRWTHRGTNFAMTNARFTKLVDTAFKFNDARTQTMNLV